MELADWCDATVAMVDGRNDHLEVARWPLPSSSGLLQNRVSDIPPLSIAWRRRRRPRAPPRPASAAVQAALDPERWPEAIEQLQRGAGHVRLRPVHLAECPGRIVPVLLGGIGRISCHPASPNISTARCSRPCSPSPVACPTTWSVTTPLPLNSPAGGHPCSCRRRLDPVGQCSDGPRGMASTLARRHAR